MPLGKDVRYRRKGAVRLAFRGNKVIEAKNMKTGKIHTPAEFAADRARSRRRSPKSKARAEALR